MLCKWNEGFVTRGGQGRDIDKFFDIFLFGKMAHFGSRAAVY